MLSVDVNGTARRFSCARQADSDVGGFRFAGTVHDASHYGEFQFFHTLVVALPLRHFVADIALDAFSQLLEGGAGGAAAAGTRRHAGREGPQAERLQEFAGGIDFLAAIAAGAGSQGNVDFNDTAITEKNPHRSRGPDKALGSHSCFGE